MVTGARVQVIGGGIIGMSIAWQLSKQGASVTVFDAGRIGNEASWAGAGMLAPGGEIEERNKLTDLAMESLGLYPGFVSELTEESGIAIDFRQCGAFSLAYSQMEAMNLQALATKQAGLGIASESINVAGVPGIRAGATAAQYYPNDAVVNPRDLIRALELACRHRQVVLREFDPVFEITEESAVFDFTVLAAGAWSHQLKIFGSGERISLPKVTPVRGHLIAFDLTGSAQPLEGPIVRHNHTYLFRRAGNIVIAGATTEHCGFDRMIDGRTSQQLASSAAELVPALSGLGYSAWVGFRPATPDGQPIIERLGNTSVWLAYGHYRNGILLAPSTARRITQEINRASSQKDSLSPAALPR